MLNHKWIVFCLSVVGLLLGSVAAHAATLVDTGPGANSTGGTSLYTNQWLAMQFTTSQDYTITDIEGWMNVSDTSDLTIAIYSGEGSTPGAGVELFSTTATQTGTVLPDWRGSAGLSWSIPAGTYWVSFEVRSGQTLSGSMPSGASALDAYAYTSSGVWTPGGFSGTGLRILGDVGITPPGPTESTPIPTMSAYGLILTTLGLLLVGARRLRRPAKRK